MFLELVGLFLDIFPYIRQEAGVLGKRPVLLIDSGKLK